MSQIHLSGIARVQHLNCVLGSAATRSVINNANYSRDIMILLLQEPWTNIRGRPLPSINYNMYTLPEPHPRCTTYVRNDINLNARNIISYENHFFKLTITVNNINIDGFKVNSPDISTHNASVLPTFNIKPNTYIAGGLNAHQNLWYAEHSIRQANFMQADRSAPRIAD